MNLSLLNNVQTEIESLHEFFCGWFTGKLPEDEFEKDFLPRFSSDLVFIPPAGRVLGFEDLSTAIKSGYGTNFDFRIQIRNVTIHRQFEDHILATYEEWQRNALASNPPNNGRVATVLFSIADDSLKWLHIHETWLPKELMEAESYDF